MSDVFHLNLTKAQLKGATLAIVPGDPARSERIAKKLDNPEFLASTREFTSWLDRKSTRLNSSHRSLSRMPSSA